MSSSMWVVQNYAELQAKYAGKWILIVEDSVIFADNDFNRVFKEYKQIRGKKVCEMILIDNGEAAFY